MDLGKEQHSDLMWKMGKKKKEKEAGPEAQHTAKAVQEPSEKGQRSELRQWR